MKTVIKKSLSIFLSALMLMTTVPVEVFAQQVSPNVVPIAEALGNKSRELGFTLRLRARKGTDFFYNLVGCGPKPVAELEELLDDYIKLYTEANDLLFMTVPEVSKGTTTPLEILANRYASDTKYDVYDLARRNVETKLDELKGYKNFVRNIKYRTDPSFPDLPPSVGYDDVKEMERIYERLVADDGETTLDLFMHGDVPTLKFAQKAEKEQFLRSVFDEALSRMAAKDPAMQERLLKGLVIGESDNITDVVSKLQELMTRLGQEAATKSSTKVNSIPNMIKTLKGLKTKKAQEEFIAEVQSKLTREQKELIREIYSQGDEVVLKLLRDSTPELGKAASQTGKAAGKVSKKILSNGLLLIAGSVLTMAMITMIDANNNSFAEVKNPNDIKRRIAQGEAYPSEVLAFYNSTYGQQEILNDPLPFASWLLSLNEGMANDKSAAMLNDEMLEVKGWNPVPEDLNKDILTGIKNKSI